MRQKKIKILALVVVLTIGLLSFGQEIPPIQVYTPELYNAENQNWAITQSEDKHIYVANNAGLLEFNGALWKLYEAPNQTIIRSVKAVGNRIYTGCYMEFGYWERNSLNELTYNSLSNVLEIPMVEDEQIWNIISLDDFIVFQSLDRIYSYSTISNVFNVIDSETMLTKMVKVNNAIYFQKLNQGIFKIENGREKLISDDEILKFNRIINVFDIDGQFVIQTNKKGCFVYKDGLLSKWNSPANKRLSTLTAYSSLRLSDGSIAVGTIANGVIKLDEKGEIENELSQNSGLSNNTVLSIFQDADHNIWLGLDNGVNCINSASPFREYEDKMGQLGSVHASKVHKGNLYIGSNQGLFVKPINSELDFELIEETKGQVWCLEVYEDTLFCGHDLGTFVINDNSVEHISNIEGTWGLRQVPGKENLLLEGSYDGLNILEKINNKWQFRNKIEGFNISTRYFEILDPNQIFVSHEYKGVFKLDIDSQFKKVLNVIKDKSVDKGLHSSLVKYNSKILYAYNKGIYSYNTSINAFEKDTLLSQVFDSSSYVSGKLAPTSDKLWAFSDRNISYISPGLLSKKPKINRIPLSSNLRKSVTGYENILSLDNQKYLLGTASGYIIIDLDKMKEQSYTIEINSIYNFALDTDKKNIVASTTSEFHNKSNNIEFTYSIAEYDKYLETEYQYRLAGNYNKWSDWSKSSSELFKNLTHGAYTFSVRGRVGNTLSDNVAVYKFTIAKPWYLSNLMILLYVIIIMLLSLLIHNVYKLKYKRQKEKLILEAERDLELKELENEQELMMLRNKQLKQDIDNKNRELAISTMSLIKKNEFLNSIKDELKNVDKTKGLNPVIKIIDKNLNNTDDWKFFEEAFNNADKDFLKKIKAKHSSLTPNDLKLCAYLRLNLSSKEIAPLLNISSRSVEVKRYRLRKKMDLPHESSLTSYILEI